MVATSSTAPVCHRARAPRRCPQHEPAPSAQICQGQPRPLEGLGPGTAQSPEDQGGPEGEGRGACDRQDPSGLGEEEDRRHFGCVEEGDGEVPENDPAGRALKSAGMDGAVGEQEAAERNQRSLNAEILARLEFRFGRLRWK